MAQVKRNTAAAKEHAATFDRNFRTFLLVSQLEAKEIGARIALARNEAGLTQDEVGELATFSKRSLQNYEAGNTIPYRHMREIAGLLMRPVPWFLHGDLEADPATTDRLERIESQLAEILGLLAAGLPDSKAPPSRSRGAQEERECSAVRDDPGLTLLGE